MHTHMLLHQQNQQKTLLVLRLKHVKNKEKSTSLTVLLNERTELKSTIFGGKLLHTLMTH